MGSGISCALDASPFQSFHSLRRPKLASLSQCTTFSIMTQKGKNVKKKTAVKKCVNPENISFLHGMYNPYNFSWPNTVPCLFLHFSRFLWKLQKKTLKKCCLQSRPILRHFVYFRFFNTNQCKRLHRKVIFSSICTIPRCGHICLILRFFKLPLT